MSRPRAKEGPANLRHGTSEVCVRRKYQGRCGIHSAVCSAPCSPACGSRCDMPQLHMPFRGGGKESASSTSSLLGVARRGADAPGSGSDIDVQPEVQVEGSDRGKSGKPSGQQQEQRQSPRKSASSTSLSLQSRPKGGVDEGDDDDDDDDALWALGVGVERWEDD